MAISLPNLIHMHIRCLFRHSGRTRIQIPIQVQNKN